MHRAHGWRRLLWERAQHYALSPFAERHCILDRHIALSVLFRLRRRTTLRALRSIALCCSAPVHSHAAATRARMQAQQVSAPQFPARVPRGGRGSSGGGGGAAGAAAAQQERPRGEPPLDTVGQPAGPPGAEAAACGAGGGCAARAGLRLHVAMQSLCTGALVNDMLHRFFNVAPSRQNCAGAGILLENIYH